MEKIDEKRMYLFKVILVQGFLFFIQMLFSIFIHEFGHYLSALLLGLENVTFGVNQFGPKVSFSNPNMYDKNKLRIVAISGSLFDLPFLLISLYFGKKKRIFGIYISSWLMLLGECVAWVVSPIINYSDAYILLKMTPNLDSRLFILTFLIIFIVLCILFNLDFYYYMKKGLDNLEK